MGIFRGDKDKNQPKADFRNVRAAARRRRRLLRQPAAAGKTYVVQKGDSLSKIAKDEYGNAENDWHKIFEANRDIIKDPDLIYPGQTLKIPA